MTVSPTGPRDVPEAKRDLRSQVSMFTREAREELERLQADRETAVHRGQRAFAVDLAGLVDRLTALVASAEQLSTRLNGGRNG